MAFYGKGSSQYGQNELSSSMDEPGLPTVNEADVSPAITPRLVTCTVYVPGSRVPRDPEISYFWNIAVIWARGTCSTVCCIWLMGDDDGGGASIQ